MRVYISGKIGEEVVSPSTLLKFAAAEEMLRRKGYEVFNPVAEDWQANLKGGFRRDIVQDLYKEVGFYAYALLRDMMAMASSCDAVLFLDDFRKSPGAMTEYRFAQAVGIRMFFTDHYEACEHLSREMCRLVGQGELPKGWLDNKLDAEIGYQKQNLHRVWLPLTEEDEVPATVDSKTKGEE